MAANNPNYLSKFIGVTYFRNANTDWKFIQLASARATVSSIDTQAKSVDVVTDTNWSVIQWDIPVNKIDLQFLENASVETMSKLFWVNKVATASWSIALVNVAQTFSAEDEIELDYQSNDDLWVTTVVVKSSDLVTTYVEDTDYSVLTTDNRTVITNLWAWIDSWATVAVSWTYNANQSESLEVQAIYRDKVVFEVKIQAVTKTTGTNQYRTVRLDKAVLSSVYNLEFLNVVQAWDITGTQATFEWLEWSSLFYDNEII